MLVAVPREIAREERRVALVPELIPKLKAAGIDVAVEAGAGDAAGFPDAQYVARGARRFRTLPVCHLVEDQRSISSKTTSSLRPRVVTEYSTPRVPSVRAVRWTQPSDTSTESA